MGEMKRYKKGIYKREQMKMSKEQKEDEREALSEQRMIIGNKEKREYQNEKREKFEMEKTVHSKDNNHQSNEDEENQQNDGKNKKKKKKFFKPKRKKKKKSGKNQEYEEKKEDDDDTSNDSLYEQQRGKKQQNQKKNAPKAQKKSKHENGGNEEYDSVDYLSSSDDFDDYLSVDSEHQILPKQRQQKNAKQRKIKKEENGAQGIGMDLEIGSIAQSLHSFHVSPCVATSCERP